MRYMQSVSWTDSTGNRKVGNRHDRDINSKEIHRKSKTTEDYLSGMAVRSSPWRTPEYTSTESSNDKSSYGTL